MIPRRNRVQVKTYLSREERAILARLASAPGQTMASVLGGLLRMLGGVVYPSVRASYELHRDAARLEVKEGERERGRAAAKRLHGKGKG
jgi:hypothetical protein